MDTLLNTNKQGRNQHGFTMVELMVSIVLSLLLLLGLVTLFVNNNRSRAEVEKANQQTENGRYALQLLSDDLNAAGYLAELNPSGFTTPASKPDPCLTDLTSLQAAMMISVQGYTATASTLSCLATAGVDFKTGTQVLVVRRASTCSIAIDPSDTSNLDSDCDPQVSGDPYLQASTCTSSTELGASGITSHFILATDATKFKGTTGMHQKNCLTSPPGWFARIHQYRTHIYYIANNDKAGDGIPTLKRLELGASGFTVVPLVEGIENWHIEYGIDIPSGTPAQLSGTPAVYTPDPDSYSTCSAATCMGYWRNVVAAKIYVLARNTAASGGYSTTKTYNLGLLADGTTVNTVGPFTDAYKRHVYESTVRLNNVAGRNSQ